MNRTFLTRLLVAAIAGGGVSLSVWLLAKRELEQEFGAGAAQLRASLTRQGGLLEEETRALCSRVAEQAIRNELASLGFTPALLRDTARTVAILNNLATRASRAGMSIDAFLSRL